MNLIIQLRNLVFGEKQKKIATLGTNDFVVIPADCSKSFFTILAELFLDSSFDLLFSNNLDEK
jgi:hypothetical protein